LKPSRSVAGSVAIRTRSTGRIPASALDWMSGSKVIFASLRLLKWPRPM